MKKASEPVIKIKGRETSAAVASSMLVSQTHRTVIYNIQLSHCGFVTHRGDVIVTNQAQVFILFFLSSNPSGILTRILKVALTAEDIIKLVL